MVELYSSEPPTERTAAPRLRSEKSLFWAHPNKVRKLVTPSWNRKKSKRGNQLKKGLTAGGASYLTDRRVATGACSLLHAAPTESIPLAPPPPSLARACRHLEDSTGWQISTHGVSSSLELTLMAPPRRYALRHDQWERIWELLPGQEGHCGVTATDNRLFVEAVLLGIGRGWR